MFLKKTVLLAGVLSVAASYASSLDETAERFECELDDRFLDANGVLRCSSGASDVTIWESKGPYENVGIVNGTFLQAMCAKYAVTGDERDLAKARRTYRAISKVYELSQEMGEGYFCKPWGWRCQDETSSDQFVYAMLGMDAFHPFATDAERREIADRIPKMARWWISRNYAYKYLGKPLNWQKCRFPTFSALAEKYAKTGEFAAELKRLLSDPVITNDLPYRCSIERGAFTTPSGKTFYVISPGTAEIGFNAVSAVLKDDPDNAYANVVMRSCYDLAKTCIQPDGSAWRYADRRSDGSWREMPASESFTDEPDGKDTRYNSLLLRFHGPFRMPAVGAVLGMVLISEHYPPAAEWVAKNAESMFAKMAERGFGRTDPQNVQPPEILEEIKRFPKHSESAAAWLQGYWTWRKLKGGRTGRGAAVDLVDPMIGAITAAEDATYGGHGLGKTFPGAATPFGMVQLSPDTVTGGDNGPGYSHHHRTIEGFSFTHMSGIGWYGDLGNFQVMPGTLDKSAYSHDDEHAEAGYYRVRLPDVGVAAELTAAARAGMIRFTYLRGGEGSFKIDLARRIGELTRAKPHGRQVFVRVGTDGFEGEIVCDHRDGGWGRGAGKADYTVFFRGRCSKPLDGIIRTGGDTNLVVRANFPVEAGEQVLLNVSISFDGLPPMPEGFDFDGMRRAARALWQEALSRVEVKGGTDRERRIFATALYHAMIDPRAIGDGDGFVRRTVFSGWDVFRSEMPLLTLVRPDVVRDTILSMAEVVTSGKRKTLPVWDLFGCESDCMLGNPIIPVIAESVNAGVTNYDVKKVYRLAKETSSVRGNIDGLGCSTNRTSLSQTLEYAFDDWCMARLAERYGTPEDVCRFDARAKWYTNCWDASVGWMRGFGPGGVRVPWRGRLAYRSATAESNPYQQAFFVPHDPEGLIALMGGKRRFTEELESLFERSSPDFLWNDYYNHPNEPCHTLPFLFAYSDKPHLVGKWTRRILSRAYGEGVMGLCGNDDVGQMSAWYVLASIGIHPMNPANGQWIVTSPLFAEATLRLDTRYAKAPTFTIRASGTEDPANVCVRSVRLNGRTLDRPWITTEEIFAGGVLETELGPEPEFMASPERWAAEK